MWDPLINIFDVVPRHCINKLTTCVQNLVHFGATWKRWDKLFLPPAFLCGVTRTLIVKRSIQQSFLIIRIHIFYRQYTPGPPFNFLAYQTLHHGTIFTLNWPYLSSSFTGWCLVNETLSAWLGYTPQQNWSVVTLACWDSCQV